MSSESPVPEVLGRYQVAEELGRGAMGVVYLAVDPVIARPVAIKVVRESELLAPAEVERFQARFRQEAEAAGRLSHPDIVRVYDIGPNFMVMEFIEGRTLGALMREGASLSVRQVSAIVTRVADAIDYAHKSGIVHRDIKPGNIMLLEDGSVKVMDFGVARLDGSKLTAAGTVIGSVRYMAPEQMMGEQVDGRADLFSLGAVAYELLVAHPPFPGQTITEVVSRVVRGGHIPPTEVDPRLPAVLNPLFARVFAIRPGDRFARAMDFAREMAEALKPVFDLPVVHKPQMDTPTEVDGTAVDEGRALGETPTASGAYRALAPESASATVMLPPGAPAPPAAKPAPGRRASADETVIVSTVGEGEDAVFGSASKEAPSGPLDKTVIMEAAAREREGVLMLDSDPAGAQAWIDGTLLGVAPIPQLEVKFGRHVVRLEVAGREPVSVPVEVLPDRPFRALSVTLPPPAEREGELRPGQYVSFGADVEPPGRVSGTLPAYPEGAAERGLEGSPVVEIWIGEHGEVMDVAILESAGALLDSALLAAVTGWRFTPARVRGVPVTVRLTVQHHFRR
ncbi:MAG: TonB family protein [Vicinamibacteria bacterium]